MEPLPRPRVRRASVVVALGLLVWFTVVGIGVRALMGYSYSPGPESSAPSMWPGSQEPLLRSGTSMLVMFAHPKCPCSRASIHELAVLMAAANGALHARVYFYRAPGAQADWERTGLWRSASAIPGVEVMVDVEGVIAQSFHANVSGETQVYRSTGELAFSGGITAARGHQGDNEGRRAILEILTTPSSTPRHTRVFGCYLRGSTL